MIEYLPLGVISVVAAFVINALIGAAVSLVVGYAANILLSEDPRSPVGAPGGLENFNIPTTLDGRAIQIIVGSPLMKSYNDIWHGDLKVVAITESVKKNAFGNHKDVTVGYKYYMGLHYGWGAYAEELLRLRMDEQDIINTELFNQTFADGDYAFRSLRFGAYPSYALSNNTVAFSTSNNRWQVTSTEEGVMYYNASTSSTVPTAGWVAVAGYGTAPTITLGAGTTDPITLLGSGPSAITSNETKFINRQGLFGGKAGQGGVFGNVSIMFGEATQPVNTYLEDTLGEGGTVPVPAFRGMVTTVAEQLHIGNVTSLKTMDAIWRRTTKNNRGEPIWYQAKAEIDTEGVKCMNIAHIINEIVTDVDYSLGFANGIDDANFRAAADTLYDEGFGLSMVLDVAENGLKALNEVIGYANGFLRVDPATNLFQIKLLRDDFVLEDLPVLDSSIITQVTRIGRESATEIFNQVTVRYTHPETREQASLMAQNTALITASNGVVVNKDMSAMGVHSTELANVLATNALQSIATNPFNAILTGNRKMVNHNIGDPIRIIYPEDNLADVVVRVVNIDYGELTNGIVTMSVTQDVFRAGEAIFSNTDNSLWEDSATYPTELTNVKLLELPYYNLARDGLGESQTALLDTSSGRPALCAVRSVQDNTFYDSWIKDSTESIYTPNTSGSVFSAYCETTEVIDQGTVQIVVGYDSGEDLTTLEGDGTQWCLVDEEIMKIILVDTINAELTLERGCIDTVPVDHVIGTLIYFVSDSYSAGVLEYPTGNTVDLKLLPATRLGQLDQDDVGSVSIAMANRTIRPYAPGNMSGAVVADGITFTWDTRNRLTQIGDIPDVNTGPVTDEVGTTYTFEARESGGALLTSIVGPSPVNYHTIDISGTGSPDFTGRYASIGIYNGEIQYHDGANNLWYDGVSLWYLGGTPGSVPTDNAFSSASRYGTFLPIGTATGSFDGVTYDDSGVYFTLKATRDLYDSWQEWNVLRTSDIIA